MSKIMKHYSVIGLIGILGLGAGCSSATNENDNFSSPQASSSKGDEESVGNDDNSLFIYIDGKEEDDHLEIQTTTTYKIYKNEDSYVLGINVKNWYYDYSVVDPYGDEGPKYPPMVVTAESDSKYVYNTCKIWNTRGVDENPSIACIDATDLEAPVFSRDFRSEGWDRPEKLPANIPSFHALELYDFSNFNWLSCRDENNNGISLFTLDKRSIAGKYWSTAGGYLATYTADKGPTRVEYYGSDYLSGQRTFLGNYSSCEASRQGETEIKVYCQDEHLDTIEQVYPIERCSFQYYADRLSPADVARTMGDIIPNL